jgi:WD40 repeat protein
VKTAREVAALNADAKDRIFPALAFARDCKTLVSIADTQVRLWDLTTRKIRAELALCSPGPYALALAPDGKTLAYGTVFGKVQLHDIKTGKAIATLEQNGTNGAVHAVAYSADGKTLAASSRAAGAERDVLLWDLATRKLKATLRGSGPVLCLLSAPDGKLLACSAGGWAVRIWDTATGKERLVLKTETHRIEFAPDGTVLVTVFDLGLKVWDTATGKSLTLIRAANERTAPDSFAFSPDGKLLASTYYSGAVRLWEVAPRKGAHSKP